MKIVCSEFMDAFLTKGPYWMWKVGHNVQASSEMVQIKFEHAYQAYQSGQSIIWPIIPENYLKIKE